MSETTDNKKFSIVWLDDSINDSQHCQTIKQGLLSIDNQCHFCTNKDNCSEYIKKQPEDVRIVLMVSGRMGKELVPSIHEEKRIDAIYIFCYDVVSHREWSGRYQKVLNVNNEFNAIKELIQARYSGTTQPSTTSASATPISTTAASETPASTTAASETSASTSEDKATPAGTSEASVTSASTSQDSTTETSTNQTGTSQVSKTTEMSTDDTSPKENFIIYVTYDLDTIYRISEALIDIFGRMENGPNDKDDFITFYQDILKQYDNVFGVLQEFKESYNSEPTIAWLYKNDFFRSLIENAYKVGCVLSMLTCRFFIHDIQKQLEQKKCDSKILVYAPETISNWQFQRLKDANGKTIAMKSFFRTNLDYDSAVGTLKSLPMTEESKRIFYTIEADPHTANVKPFAKLDTLVPQFSPNEVLFMIGSLFKITEIQEGQDGIINVKMSLCSDDSEDETKKTLDQLKSKHIDSEGKIDLLGLGQFLLDLGTLRQDPTIYGKGEEVVGSCLNNLPTDQIALIRCYDINGTINLQKNNIDSSIDFFQKSLELKKEKLQKSDPNLIKGYENLIRSYILKNDFTKALELSKEGLPIAQQVFANDETSIICYYNTIAEIYERLEESQNAISYYMQALALMIKNNNPDPTSLAAVYTRLGNLYDRLPNHNLALGFHQMSLEIKLKIYPDGNNPSLALTYKNLGLIYKFLNDFVKARENFEKAVEIYGQLPNPDQSSVQEIQTLIESLQTPST